MLVLMSKDWFTQECLKLVIVNASLSKDEIRVLLHLRDQFNINDDDHSRIEADLRDMIRQKPRMKMSSTNC